jgi:hypothetical protein
MGRRCRLRRQALWQRQRRLTPPLVLGEMTPMAKRLLESGATMLNLLSNIESGTGPAADSAATISLPLKSSVASPTVNSNIVKPGSNVGASR